MAIQIDGISSSTIAPIVAFQVKPDSSSNTESTDNVILFVTSGTQNTGTIHEVTSVSRAKELFADENAYNFVEAFFKNYQKTIYVLVVADVDTATAKIGSERFDLVATTFNTTSDLAKWKTWADSRFGAVEQNPSHVFISKADTVNNLSTYGDGLDNKHLTVLEKSVSESESVHLGAVLGQIASSADNDPALPFQNLEVKGLTVPSVENRFSFTERNLLLTKGISTFTYGGDKVYIDMVVTTYKTNDTGQDDTQFRDLNDVLNASYLRRDLTSRIQSKYPRYKAGDDGGTYDFNSNVLTPKTLKAEVISKVREWETRGFVQNADNIISSITVTRIGDRFEISVKLELISQARQIVGELQVQS